MLLAALINYFLASQSPSLACSFEHNSNDKPSLLPQSCNHLGAMSQSQGSRSLAICSRCLRNGLKQNTRQFSITSRSRASVQEHSPTTQATPEPIEDVKNSSSGSRRRRMIIEQLGDSAIPFHKLPYQCFQEARKVLREDREEKLKQIEITRSRIAKLKAQDCAPQDEARKEHRIRSMQTSLEQLKIHADINDPLVKKRFQDGQGMTLSAALILQY